MLAVLNLLFPHQRHRHHPEALQKYKALGTTLNLRNQNL